MDYRGKKVAFHTLGCKLNFSETSTIGRLFMEQGFQKVKFSDAADVYVINTCSVTNVADKKCRQTIKKAIKTSPNAFIVVTGCYAQLKPEEISNIEGVDIVLGTNDKFNALKFIEDLQKKDRGEIHSCKVDDIKKFSPSYSIDDRTRSFLKVQDGCSYSCSFCAIPKARGKSRNSKIDTIVEKANEIANNNIKEIVLTGINIGDFGKSTGEKFIDLIKALEQNTIIKRYRISSIEPNLLSDEIIDFIAQSKRFVPHFHIPLQSGANKILGLMKRRYNTTLFKQRVERIRKTLPNAFIGVDVIAGFNGETEEDFATTCQFLEDLPISELHVFTYSERAETKALDIQPVVPIEERRKRSKILQNLSDKKQAQFYQTQKSNTVEVLFENQNYGGKLLGFSDNYIRVEQPFKESLKNTIKKVTLQKLTSNGTFVGN